MMRGKNFLILKANDVGLFMQEGREEIVLVMLQRLMLELVECGKKRSLRECGDFVSELVSILGVREIMRQQVEITNRIPNAKPGVTVSVIFLESDLVLHTWPEESFADLKITCCRPFDPDVVATFFKEFFISARIKEVLNESPWIV